MRENAKEYRAKYDTVMKGLDEQIRSVLEGKSNPLEYIEESLISLRKLCTYPREGGAVIYDRMGGVARVFMVTVRGKGCAVQTAVTDVMLERWGISEDDLRVAALKNREKKKLIVRGLEDLRKEAEKLGIVIPLLTPTGGGEKCAVVTCKGVNGAAQILRPEAREKVRELIGGNFIVFLSSGEEAICTDVSGMTMSEIRENIWSANEQCGGVALDTAPYGIDIDGTLYRIWDVR